MAQADYPNNIPVLPIVTDKQQYPRSEEQNKRYREIEAICTELGTNPKAISDAVAAEATPADVADYLDQIANRLKTITGAATWDVANVPRRTVLGGCAGGATIPAASVRYFTFGGLSSGAAAVATSRTRIAHSCVEAAIGVYISTAQPASGNMLITAHEGLGSGAFYINAGSAAGFYTGTISARYPKPGGYLSLYVYNQSATDASAAIQQFYVELDQVG